MPWYLRTAVISGFGGMQLKIQTNLKLSIVEKSNLRDSACSKYLKPLAILLLANKRIDVSKVE